MGRYDAVIRRVYVAAALVWAALLFLTPLLAKSGTAIADGLALAMYAGCTAICHQRPERSFALFGTQMPVCARCTGIYVGAAVASIAAAWIASGTEVAGKWLASSVPGRMRPWAIALASTFPSLATLVYEWTTGDMPSNWMRAAAGVPMGVAASWLVVRRVN